MISAGAVANLLLCSGLDAVFIMAQTRSTLESKLGVWLRDRYTDLNAVPSAFK